MGDGPSPLARLLGTGQRPMRVIDFPGDRGNEVSVGIWNLLQWELQSARIDAMKWITDVCKVPDSALLTDASLADEETKNQILFRALRNPNSPMQPFAASVNELRTLLTPDERDALFTQYLDFVEERSPLRRIQSESEVDELIVALGKGSTRGITLQSFDSNSLRSIAASLADRCLKLMKQNSSDSSQPTGSSLLSHIRQEPSE